jgi:hypothetical protein
MLRFELAHASSFVAAWLIGIIFVGLSESATALGQTTSESTAAAPPTSWVDADTGHRVHRLTPEPGSSGFYFNINAYTPDGKTMVYNAPDESLFCGDGGDPGQVAKAPDGQWIELFHPEMLNEKDPGDKNLIQPGVFHAEHLVNMSKQNYKQEPNVRFSPDHKMVIFTSNMFGDSYVFGVETDKAH